MSSTTSNQIYREYKSSVSPKGQITLPIDGRNLSGIRPKDTVTIRVYPDGSMEIVPAKRSLADFYRSVPALKIPLTDGQIREMVQEKLAEKYVAKP